MTRLFELGTSRSGYMMLVPFAEGHFRICFNENGGSTVAALRMLVTQHEFTEIWLEFIANDWSYSFMIDPSRPPIFIMDPDKHLDSVDLSPLVKKVRAGVPIQVTEHGLLVED